MHDGAALDHLNGRVLRGDLAVQVLCFYRNTFIFSEKVTQIVGDRVRAFGAVIFLYPFEYFVARDGARISDEIHVAYGVFGAGNKVDELFREFSVCAFGHHPAVEPDIAALFGNGVIQKAISLFSLVYRGDRVAAPCEIDVDFARRRVQFAAVHFESV